MKKIFLVATVAVAILGATPAQAGPLDGSYTSSRGNSLTIRGNSYTYTGVRGGPARSTGSVRVGPNSVQFSGGYLRYSCDRSGPTLTCGRVWWSKN